MFEASSFDVASRIDVILITAAKEVQALQDAIRGGVFDFILKPMTFSRFQGALLSYQKQRNQLDTLDNLEQRDVEIPRHLGGLSNRPVSQPAGAFRADRERAANESRGDGDCA